MALGVASRIPTIAGAATMPCTINHLAIATHLEHEIANGTFRQVKHNSFAHHGVDVAKSLDHIKEHASRDQPYFSGMDTVG